MSEDKLRQDIREILEDARFSITASDEWIDRFIARVRAEDTVKSTGVSLPRDAATAMYQEYSRVGSNLIEGFQAAYAKGYQAGRDDAHFQQLIAEAQQEIKERFDMKPGVVGEPGPDTELSGNAEANTIPWHVAIDNTGRATVGRRISKRVIALVKTSSRYGHVYTKTGPLTYTCTGCGGRIYPISKDTPAVQDHMTGVDGCIRGGQEGEDKAGEGVFGRGTLALCSQGALGLITSNAKSVVAYPDGTSGFAWRGIHLTNMRAPVGAPWSSRHPKVIGQVTDIELFLSLMVDGEAASVTEDTDNVGENSAPCPQHPGSTGGNEDAPPSPLARPSSPPPSTLNQARYFRGYAPLPTLTCSCSLCDAARLLGLMP